MKFFITTLVVILGVLLQIGRAEELVYTLDLKNEYIKNQIDNCPYAKITKDFEGTDVLTINVPEKAFTKDGNNLVAIPIDLNQLGVLGKFIIGEGDISYNNVSKPKMNYNGVKCMLVYRNIDKNIYGDFYRPKLGPTIRYGSVSWTHYKNALRITANAKNATLNLGLQDSFGSVSFRNIRLFCGDSLPKSTLELKEIPQAKYTYKRKPMRGVMSPSPINFKEKDFADLQQWGVNLVRWQMTPAPYSIGQRRYTFEQWREKIEARIDQLQNVLDTAQKYGIKIVIDLHTGGGLEILGWPQGQKYFIEFWTKVVKRYKGHPAIYGYDLMNEPHSRNIRPGYPSWNELADRAIKAIREIDPVSPIIVEADHMASSSMLEYLPIFPYPNIIYSIHTYNPGSITHQLNRNDKNFAGYPDAHWNKQTAIRDYLEPVRKFQLKTGARIYVGEFGCVRWAPGADQYIKDSIDYFEECGWDWTYHAFREWDGWSAEHSDDPKVSEPVPTTKRKQVLLEAFKKNMTE